ncbi:hypothetical protein TDB9533_03502 [Thalassocella blandensis]|nr:hypothetical protein TDB9533_03502 [Thalassocella blandensis]
MTAQNYNKLALAWIPDSHDTRLFYIVTAIVFAVVLVLALAVTFVDVPEKERRARQAVPERVAEFITEKKKVEPPKPAPTPVPTPKPIPTPKPKVARKTETEAEKQKPLTQKEQKAREKAANTGLLALGSELADLIDTSDVNEMVGSKIKKTSGDAKKVAGVDSKILTADAGKGSGGVNTGDYAAGVSGAQLSQRDVALVKQSLLKGDQVEKAKTSSGSGERTGNVRSEEEVTIVFDQNKSQLYQIYNRERRKKPGLKGKIVLEITIAPDGSVTNVRIASSELNDPALERRLIARVKQFKFGQKSVEPVTVTFPIEFLPS